MKGELCYIVSVEMRETLQLPTGKCRKERGVDQVSQVIFDLGED